MDTAIRLPQDFKEFLRLLEANDVEYLLVGGFGAASEGYIQVIDESGEDYTFTADRFYIVNLPADVEETLLMDKLALCGL